jgi:hypothetical protein
VSTAATTVMWEAVAAAGRVEELLAWARERIPAQAQLYRSVGDRQRVVVIDPTAQAAALLTAPPAELLDRAPHSWEFEPA